MTLSLFFRNENWIVNRIPWNTRGQKHYIDFYREPISYDLNPYG